MIDIHAHYDLLTETERKFVDQQFRRIFQDAKTAGIALRGDDDAERAVDALAALILSSKYELVRQNC
jgi:hypothetical protein